MSLIAHIVVTISYSAIGKNSSEFNFRYPYIISLIIAELYMFAKSEGALIQLDKIKRRRNSVREKMKTLYTPMINEY